MNSILSAGSFVFGVLTRAVSAYRTRPALFQPTMTGLLLLVGILFLDFHIGWVEVAYLVLTACLVETVAAYAVLRRAPTLRTALSAAFSLALFFRATHWYLYVLVAAVAILSKYVIRNSRGHLFNPSNFAIVLLIFLLPSSATIQFIEWGSNVWVYLLISLAVLGVAVWATRTADMTFSFLASQTLLFTGVAAFVPHLVAPHHYGILSPVLVIFAAFMITDPQTAPQGRTPRIFYGISIAFTYFFLELLGVRYALFLALPVVLLLNALSGLLIRTLRPSFLSERLATLPTLIISVVAFSLMFFVATRTMDRTPTTPSLNFVLFGIQSSELFECKVGKVFNQNTHVGIDLSRPVVGSSWADYDNDGDDDLLLSRTMDPAVLYRNESGRFVDVTASSGLPPLYAVASLFGDYDNDGDQDLFLVMGGRRIEKEQPPVRFYRNQNGHFVEATEQVGLGELRWPVYSLGALSLADYDNDGLLDLTVARSGRHSRFDVANEAFSISLQDPLYSSSSTRVCGSRAVREFSPLFSSISDPLVRDDIQTILAEEYICVLVHNFFNLLSGGDASPVAGGKIYSFNLLAPGSVYVFKNSRGRLVEQVAVRNYVDEIIRRTPEAALNEGLMATGTLAGAFFQPISFDYDGDGATDIFFASDFGSSLLLRNEGNFNFTDRSTEAGVDFSASGMGVDVGDPNRDGLPDLLVTNTLDDYLYYNRGDGTFSKPEKGLGRQGIGWGASFLDYDLDGWEDIFVANGDILRTVDLPLFELSTAYFRADRLYRNVTGDMVDRTWKDYCSDSGSGRALSVADYDRDGDIDVFVGNISSPRDERPGAINFNALTAEGGAFYENSIRDSERPPYYLGVLLKGTKSNAMGVGAVVNITSSTGVQTRFVVAGSSYNSQNSALQLFGLGQTKETVRLEIRWPSGVRTVVPHVNPNQILTVVEQ